MMYESHLKGQVLVLNQNYEPMTVCDVKRAIILIYLGKAEVIERSSSLIHSVSISIPFPLVVQLQYHPITTQFPTLYLTSFQQ